MMVLHFDLVVVGQLARGKYTNVMDYCWFFVYLWRLQSKNILEFGNGTGREKPTCYFKA